MAQTSQKIVVLSPAGREEEATATVAINPGYLCKMASSPQGFPIGTVKPQDVAGARAERLIAQEQALRGWPFGYLDQYAIGDLVSMRYLNPNDIAMFKLAANALAVPAMGQLTPAGDGTLKLLLASGVLYDNVANSTPITNVSAETNFSLSYVLPANTLSPSDALRIRGMAKVTGKNAAETLTVKVKVGAVTIAASAAVNVAVGDYAEFDVLITVNAIGNAATGQIAAMGSAFLGTIGTTAPRPLAMDPTLIDTTIANTIVMSATWSAANAANIVVQEEMVVDLTRYNALNAFAVALETVDNSAGSTETYIRARCL